MNITKQEPRYDYFFTVISLPLLSMFILYLEHVTHNEFLLHVAAIPLEILLGAIVVERFLAKREKQRRSRQLMLIKSCLFRTELRKLYLTNFAALSHPRITMQDIKDSNNEQLFKWMQQTKNARYSSPEAMESVINEYVNAYDSFNRFLEWSIENDIERIFYDMIMLLHFIHDATLYKHLHPDELFINKAQEEPELMERVNSILTQGIISFLRFCMELRSTQPILFDILINDYLIISDNQIKATPCTMASCQDE